MSERKTGGYTLVEFLVVALIVAVCSASIGPGFAKLSALEDHNREKAVTLEKLCDRFVWTQPFIAVGAVASNSSMTRVDITYPHIVFGIACETNSYGQVTNCTVRVRDDGVLQTIIHAGGVTGLKSVTNSMDWMDALFVGKEAPALASSQVAATTNGLVILRYAYTNVISEDEGESDVVLSVPVKLRNNGY